MRIANAKLLNKREQLTHPNNDFIWKTLGNCIEDHEFADL